MDVSALFGLLTSGASLLAGRGGKGKATDAWQTAAETYGLLYKPATFWKGPRLSGSLAGNRLTVDIKDRNTASAATRFRLDMTPLNLGLRMKKKGFWNSLRPRTAVGDRAFDSQVVVDGRSRLAVQEFLTPERRTAIRVFLGSFKGAVVTDDEISLKIRGSVKKSDEMLAAIDAMQQVASVLADKPHASSLGQATDAAVAVISPKPKRDPELLPVENTKLADAPAQEPYTTSETELAATPSIDVLASEGNMPSIDEFCATVFAPGALSFVATQIFRESYEGKQVVWTGTLESVTPFTFDFDFGSGRGIKAILTILESEDAESHSVQAVIGLPPDIEGLPDHIGRRVTFSGRLLKVDGLAKRVLITDAALRP